MGVIWGLGTAVILGSFRANLGSSGDHLGVILGCVSRVICGACWGLPKLRDRIAAVEAVEVWSRTSPVQQHTPLAAGKNPSGGGKNPLGGRKNPFGGGKNPAHRGQEKPPRPRGQKKTLKGAERTMGAEKTPKRGRRNPQPDDIQTVHGWIPPSDRTDQPNDPIL